MSQLLQRSRQIGIAVPIIVPVIVVSVFVLRGCDTASVPLVKAPTGVTSPAAAATSTPADLTALQLAGVGGTTTLVPVRATGSAHLSGSVSGPQGPIPGATVRVEHLVDDRPPPIDVLTDVAGHWDLPNIAGGRYRVRSWFAPSLAQTQPQIFFLADGEQRNADLGLESFSGLSLAAAIAPDPPQLNQSVNLVVRVARQTVDSGGVVRVDPVANASVVLTNAPGWSVRGPSAIFTSGNGDAAFGLDCRSAGANQVQVAVRATPADQPLVSNLQVTACVDPRATSTSLPSSGGPTTTATTAPGSQAPN